MTRPRRPSGTASWIVALAVAAITMPPAPTGTISSSESGYDVDVASSNDATPSTIAPSAMRMGRGFPESTSPIAAVKAPSPEAAIRKPNPAASLPSASWASGGITTWKFMPNVAVNPTVVTAISTIGVFRTNWRPSARFSITAPTDRGRGMSLGRWSSWSRITDSETMTARKLRALSAKAVAMPKAPIVRPATAGPITRAPLNIAELIATALPTSRAPTISIANAWRTGMSTAFAQPRSRASTMIIQTSTTPVSVSTVRTIASSIITTCTASSVCRFGRTSASTPANSPSTITGRNCAPATTPSQNGSPVSVRTSQPWATCWTQVPMSESAWPTKNSR